MKPFPSTGKIRIPACCGMAVQQSANRAVSPAATASRCARVTRSWKNPCSGMRELRICRTKTVCTYCGVGCSFDVWTKDRHILKVEPLDGPTNGISTCVKGKFGWDFVNSADRLTKPLIREGAKFREVSWDEALDLVARKFAEIKAKNGPDSLAFASSSKCTNEESYLMQKLARAVIGTNK